MTRPKKIKLIKVKYPITIEKVFSRKCRVFQSKLNGLTRNLIEKISPYYKARLVQQAAKSHYRTNSLEDDLKRVLTDSNTVNEVWSEMEMDKMLSMTVEDIDNYNLKNFTNLDEAILGIDVFENRALYQSSKAMFKQETRKYLIKIYDDHFMQAETLIFDGLRFGDSQRTLAKKLMELKTMKRSKANLIARDQVSKLNGQINKIRQTKLGITDFIWNTVGDSRVRSEHREHEGKKYSWSKGAAGNYPGRDIQCRCTADAVLKYDN